MSMSTGEVTCAGCKSKLLSEDSRTLCGQDTYHPGCAPKGARREETSGSFSFIFKFVAGVFLIAVCMIGLIAGAVSICDSVDDQYSHSRPYLSSEYEAKIRVATTYFNLGDAYYDKDELDLARACYEKSLATYPCAVAKNNLAYVYALTNTKLDEAMALVDEALESEPLNASFLDTKGWIFYRQGELEWAEWYLTWAVKNLQDNSNDSRVIKGHLMTVWNELTCRRGSSALDSDMMEER